jgi:hypothetical protein
MIELSSRKAPEGSESRILLDNDEEIEEDESNKEDEVVIRGPARPPL